MTWEAQSADWIAWARTPGHDWFDDYSWPTVVDLLPAPGRATLDLGCGEGRTGRALAALGHPVTGLDGSPTLAAAAREGGGYVDVVCADAAAMPFAEASFDFVLAFMSLLDFVDLTGSLREVARVLEPGGRLVATLVHPLGDRAPSYFACERLHFPAERDGLRFTFDPVHRPLEAYFGALREAGLLAEHLREPPPPDRHLRDENPHVLHLLALRP